MQENKGEKIFDLLLELPLERWETAINDKNNFTTMVDGVEVYIKFLNTGGIIIYIGEDDSCSFHINNIQLVSQFRNKVIEYFKQKVEIDRENKMDKIYNSLKNSVCQSVSR